MPVQVTDPFSTAGDAKMPFIARALDPEDVRMSFDRHLDGLFGRGAEVRLCTVEVVRYKPASRCLIAYELEVQHPSKPSEKQILLGKARAAGLNKTSHDVQLALWRGDFGARSRDGISVPEVVGAIPEFHMWLQRRVPGVVATELLAGSDGVALTTRIAEALYKLHQAAIATTRRHTFVDELRILRERLDRVVIERPHWTDRIERVYEACQRLATTIPEPVLLGIHRDFYPDQVIIDGSSLYLLDFDLYCAGDPALDLGNFIGHLTEHSLRLMGDPCALRDREEAFARRYRELAATVEAIAIRSYSTLTLVRHIYLSTQFPQRRPFTERILELCEKRLVQHLNG